MISIPRGGCLVLLGWIVVFALGVIIATEAARADEPDYDSESWTTYGEDAERQQAENRGYYDYSVETDLDGSPWEVEFTPKRGEEE